MLTKEQIANLSTEQQETLAAIELRSGSNRQALLDEIRGLNKPWYRGWTIITSWLFGFAIVYFNLQIVLPSPRSFACAVTAVMVIYIPILAYTSNLSRRLKALVELLEHDGVLEAVPKRPQESKPDAQN